MDVADLVGTPLHIDVFDLLAQLPDESVNLVFCDPPYNIGIFAKMPADEYLVWCGEWITEASRVLAANGAFWVVHKDPAVLVDLSRMVASYGKARTNWITWDKYNESGALRGFLDGYTLMGELRSFQVMAEYLVYHADEGEWTAQCDKERGFIFEPLRAYLDGERRRAGVNFEQVRQMVGCRPKSGLPSHWFTRSQWMLPTEKNYRKLQAGFNAKNGKHPVLPYEDYHRAPRSRFEPDLRADYEYLRADYEDLRYIFNNPGKVSSVWQIPPAPKNGHPTPKPEALLERIIETTSNEGDIVLDFFAGSFTTATVAERLDRRWICGDHDEQWVALGAKRLNTMQVPMF